MQRVKVSKKNQISIPSAVRHKLGIKPGDTLLVDVRGIHALLMREPENYEEWSERFWGLGKEVWAGVDATEYVRRERRGEWTD